MNNECTLCISILFVCDVRFERMKKVKLPEGAIRNKMKQDKIDAYWVRDFFGEAQPVIAISSGPKPMEPPSAKPDMSKFCFFSIFFFFV